MPCWNGGQPARSEADDETVSREAAARGVEVTPLSFYYAGDSRAPTVS
jgi:hypothetical protein